MTDRTRRPVLRGSSATLALAPLVTALTLLAAGCGATTTSGEPATSASGAPADRTPATTTSAATSSSSSSSGVASTADPTPGNQSFTTLQADTGRLLETTLAGAASGVTMKVWVWLPPAYDQPAYAHTAFPALMLYPGGTGAGRNAWVGTALGAREADATGAAAGTTTPFVFVMPSMQVSDHLDTECTDLPGQPKVGTFLSVDVRAMALENFRIIPDRGAWGAAGTSSGAYCASRLVFDHPDQYAALVSIGGYFSIETTLAGATAPAVRAGDPAAVATANPPDVSVLLWAGGTNDITVAQRFLDLIKPPTQATLRVQSGGAHLTVDFAKLVPGTLQFLSQKLSHPAPAS